MQRMLLVVLALVLLASLVLILFAGDDRKVSPPKTVAETGPKTPKPTPLPPRLPLPAEQPKPTPKAPETLTELARIGLLGQSERWVEALMARGAWQREGQSDKKVYRGHEGVTLEWKSEGGVITGARATFPATAVSASVTALTPYLLGEHFSMPIHFESEAPLVDPVILNNFFDEDTGRRFFLRAIMRNTGPSPYGPQRVDIGFTPFEGQSHAQSPQADRWSGVKERETQTPP